MRKVISLLIGFSICFGVQAEEIESIGQSYRIYSKSLQEERSYVVTLPKSYQQAPNKRYPVLYVLDAQEHFLHSASATTFLASAGQIPEMIVIAIKSTNRLRDFSPTDWKSWVGGGGAKHFLSFLSTELIPSIETRFRADKLRLIFGHSASALFVLYSLYAEPDLFDAYLASDGMFDWDDKIVEKELAKLFQSNRSLKKYVHFTSSYLMDVEPEFDYFASLENMFKENCPTSLRWKYQTFQNETHGSIPLLGFIHALRDLFYGWQAPEQIIFEGFDAVQSHYKSIAGQIGAPEVIPEDVLNNLGYHSLNTGKTEEAIKVFKMNINNHPLSANAFDSVADAYLKAGLLAEALSSVKKSVELATQFENPNLSQYKDRLKEVEMKLREREEKK